MDATSDRYVVVSADCHAGASLDIYGHYLEHKYYDDFKQWRREFNNPFSDLLDTGSRGYRRNFDSTIRQEDLEGDGIVGEVIFPNTVPPFYDGIPLVYVPDVKDSRELELRWAGIRAHNRWLADFCQELPGRRAGIAQVLLEDVEAAVTEIRWAKEAGLFGGILVPNPSTDSTTPQLHAPLYEPIWAACAETGLPLTFHGGTGMPDQGPYPATGMLMFVEMGWYSQRPLPRLMFSGALERHPDLIVVFTETGSRWVHETLEQLDWFFDRVQHAQPGSVEAMFGSSVKDLSLEPSEYWARQCYVGASFMSPRDCAQRHRTGLDRLMWGSDYPHGEGTHPYTLESLRFTFAGVDRHEVELMLGMNAARVYDFDLDALTAAARLVGPTVDQIAQPLDPADVPHDATTMALSAR